VPSGKGSRSCVDRLASRMVSRASPNQVDGSVLDGFTGPSQSLQEKDSNERLEHASSGTHRTRDETGGRLVVGEVEEHADAGVGVAAGDLDGDFVGSQERITQNYRGAEKSARCEQSTKYL
jgi:hypothetical protein